MFALSLIFSFSCNTDWLWNSCGGSVRHTSAGALSSKLLSVEPLSVWFWSLCLYFQHMWSSHSQVQFSLKMIQLQTGNNKGKCLSFIQRNHRSVWWTSGGSRTAREDKLPQLLCSRCSVAVTVTMECIFHCGP